MSKANLIIEEVNKVIIGKEKVIRKVWMTILSGGHVLLEDVPGVGKTTMALAFSKALGLSYRRRTGNGRWCDKKYTGTIFCYCNAKSAWFCGYADASRVTDGSFYGSFIYGISNNKGRNDSYESEKGE